MDLDVLIGQVLRSMDYYDTSAVSFKTLGLLMLQELRLSREEHKNAMSSIRNEIVTLRQEMLAVENLLKSKAAQKNSDDTGLNKSPYKPDWKTLFTSIASPLEKDVRSKIKTHTSNHKSNVAVSSNSDKIRKHSYENSCEKKSNSSLNNKSNINKKVHNLQSNFTSKMQSIKTEFQDDQKPPVNFPQPKLAAFQSIQECTQKKKFKESQPLKTENVAYQQHFSAANSNSSSAIDLTAHTSSVNCVKPTMRSRPLTATTMNVDTKFKSLRPSCHADKFVDESISFKAASSFNLQKHEADSNFPSTSTKILNDKNSEKEVQPTKPIKKSVGPDQLRSDLYHSKLKLSPPEKEFKKSKLCKTKNTGIKKNKARSFKCCLCKNTYSYHRSIIKHLIKIHKVAEVNNTMFYTMVIQDRERNS